MTRTSSLVAGCLAFVLAGGCETVGLNLEDLPAAPIAVTYWGGEEARRRAELLEQEEKNARQRRRGVAQVDALRELLGLSGEPDKLSRYPGRLSLVDPTTGKVTPIAQAPRGALALAWSPDHDRLLSLSSHRQRIQVYEYMRSKKSIRTVTYGERPHLFADYGLGRQMALLQVANAGGRYVERVFVTDSQGGSPRLLFEDRSADAVRLSPDGETLIYSRRSGELGKGSQHPSGLVAVNLVTGEERDLGPGREPSFSREGDWIVYSAPSRDGWRLRRMRPDGSAKSPISAGTRDEMMPSVSPDGRFVVYVREETGQDRLFVRRMDGTGDRILLDAGAVFTPVW